MRRPKPYGARWSQKEDAAIRAATRAPGGPWNVRVLPVLPGRTHGAIRTRAWNLRTRVDA